MDKQRAIPSDLNVPDLDDDLIEKITSLCFQKTDDRKSDALFVFGTWSSQHILIESVQKALSKSIAPIVFINGGIPAFEKTGTDHVGSADRIMESINPSDYPNTQFIIENTAIHTLEEVQKSIKLYDFSRLNTISYIAKAHAATRQMLTLKKYIPCAEIRALPYEVSYPNEGNITVTHKNWIDNKRSTQRVWGQFLRIKKYGERGDIAYLENIKNEVDYIISKTGYVLE